MSITPFAVFLVAPIGDSTFAGVTRPDGSVGLPGGKVDPGESWEAALVRESAEEGWQLPASAVLRVLHCQNVDGRAVLWALLLNGVPIPVTPSDKDVARGVRPVVVKGCALQGFGNPEALACLQGGVQ